MRKYLQFSITRSQILMRIPAEQSKMFSKVGVPVNFFIQPSYKKTDLAKCLLSFAVECTLEKEVRLFEMAVPKERVGFYLELGFVQMELVALQAYIKHDA